MREETPPTITDVAVTSTPLLTSTDGSTTHTYGVGETIEVSVTFTEAVNATSDTDFVLSVDGAKRAALLRGSGTTTLVFGYTVLAADADDDGIWIGDQDRTLVGDRMSNAQAGTITSVDTGVKANLIHSALNTLGGHRVDGGRSIVLVEVTSTPMLETDTYGADETIQFTVTFNAAVDVTGDPVYTFSLANSGGSNYVNAAYESGSGTAELVFGYTVLSTDMDGNGIYQLGGETDFSTVKGPVGLDADDAIQFTGTSADAPLAYPVRTQRSGHKVDGSQTAEAPPTPTNVLVSNMGQADSGPGSNINDTWLAAQGFSVPSGGGNYTLTSIEILVSLDISSTNIGSLTVSVWSADSSGHPDSSLHTLTNPASVTAEVAASFTAPASATLEAGNTYVVLADYDLTGNRNWMSTNANSEDATSTAGWTIANTGLYRGRTATSWTNRGSAFFLQVNGTAPPDAPTNFTAKAGDTQVTLAWEAVALDSGVTGHEFRYKTDADYPMTWTAIADSGPDEANEASFTVTGLTNEEAHTFELRAVSAAGNGGAATAGPVTPTPGICDRTEILHEYIVDALSGVDNCAAVTVADLAGLSRVDVGNYGITSLKSGDFAGLTSLTYLNLGLNSLAMLPEDVFSDLTALTQLYLISTALSSLPEDVFSGLTALTRLDLDNNNLSSLDAGLFSELTSLTTLNLGRNSLAMLPEDVFSDLTALTRLDLYDNDLSSLDAGLFSGLTALTDLRLYNNDLSLLPGTVFSDLTALDILYCNDNDLNALPDELFTGLTSLTTLTLGSNSTNPMELTVTVEKVGTNQVRAKVLAGAPFAVDLPVTLVDGTLEGSVTVLGVAAGEVDGAPVTVTRTAGTTAAVTVDVDLTTQPTRPTDHTGYIFKKATVNLPATILPDATNAAPAFTSSTTFNPAENQTAVGTVEAEDSDTADEITGYALNGGADQALFAINSGVLTFQAPPNYEDPQDANTDNAYVVVVRATSGTGARVKTMDQTITVTVMDEDEPPAAPDAPTVSATPGSTMSLDVSWTAPAITGKPAITSYDLRYRVGDRESWTDGPQDETGTTATITGLAADTEHQVQVRASNDEGDSGWSASGTGSTNEDTDTPTVELGELEDRIQAINCALDALDGESDARCADIEGMSGSNRDLVALQLEVIGQLPPGKYDYYDLAGWQTLFKMGNGRVVITKAGAAGPAPLTARLTGIPEAHDGETAFRFQVAFSEDVGIDEQSLRDHSFTVSGGEVTGAQRDRHDLWEITVAPDSDGDVTITLPGDRECGTAGAVCTRGDDPSPLTNSPSETVAGPADDARDPNTAATGTPTISGTPQVGETLTADTSGIADEDGLENVSFSYQWLADDTAIQGATNSTYTLIEVDEGKAVTVRVSFTDDGGNDETLTSAATATVEAAPNSPATGAPTISGTAQVGEALTADTSGIADTDGLEKVTLSYQWLADDTATQGATGSTYTVLEADEGKAIKVRVSFTDDGGNDETLTSAATDVVAGNEEPVAREDAADWSATMTVEWVYQGYGYYSTDTKKAGSLAPASFNVDGTRYTVKMVETQGWWTYIGVDRELPFGFVLELDETRFASGDASFNSYSYGNIYRWEGTGLSLSDGDAVEVRLLRALEDETAVNSPATGQPVISGTAQVGETLTADTSGIADEDGLDNASFSYQWQADDTDISGATGSTYTLADADEGKTVKVQVSFTDEAGNEESLTSEATAAVTAAPAPNNPSTGAPTISGTVQVGETLTADTSAVADEDGLENVSFSYQWLTDDTAIQDATNATYTLADADEGKAVKVQVSFTDDAGNEESLTSAATDAVAPAPAPNSPATGEPTISGAAQVGETLTADTSGIADEDGLDAVAFSYQWLADDTDISGATGTTYTLADADEGNTVKVRVSFTDDGGNDETLTSAATNVVAGNEESAAGNEEPVSREDNAAWSATMTVEWVYQGYGYYSTDTKKAGALSPASFNVDGTKYTVKMVETQGWWTYIGTDRELPFDFVLELDGTSFASGDASFNSYSYGNIYRWEGTGLSLSDGDAVEVRLLRAVEDETAVNSAATGAPVISGTAQVGETLTADTSGIEDADGLDNAAYSYQWQADDTDISGATDATYTLADADEGKTIRVRASFTDEAGNEESLTSEATAAVTAAPTPNNPSTGAPTISGTAQVGETLTADTSGISDADGLTSVSYSYQWIRNDGNSDSAISGATAGTYTLADGDEGKTITVKVSFTDDAGNNETLTSAATDAVTATPTPNSPATGVPTISGTAQVGETLTADTSGIEDADGLDNADFSYQWLADNTDISGATGSNYTLTDSDKDKAIRVRASFTDEAGNEESLTSEATDAVAAAPAANTPATGTPSISGTAQVGETLTADTSGIDDDDGISNATFSYQWQADDTDISGATDATYTLVAADEGKTIRVRVSFTDDAGNEESLTSEATDAVAAVAVPLTASLENTPDTHDGQNGFSFELRFSEEFSLSYKTLRNHAFTVAGGTVQKANRITQGGNIRWRITVRPDGDGQVTVTLPETTDCDAEGAICTGDGRMLSNELVLTVNGPGQ